jgi:predicted flap endonuclease-1-like 5' DNA nuclease
MIPTGERALWFLLGFVVGWLVLRFMTRRSRLSQTAAPAPQSAAATPASPVPSGTLQADLRSSDAVSHDSLPPGPSPSRLIDVSAARAAGFNMKHADDLTVIEGIGPKTDEWLRTNGVESFVQVAQLHADQLVDILDRGGPSFRLANPASWPQQALLAAENRWPDLKRFQNEMIEGDAQQPGGS